MTAARIAAKASIGKIGTLGWVTNGIDVTLVRPYAMTAMVIAIDRTTAVAEDLAARMTKMKIDSSVLGSNIKDTPSLGQIAYNLGSGSNPSIRSGLR
ncbi:hypothetical protein ASG68_29280 [Rhizobium sp. Leaf453]|uniref:hypothetical protein n=1 Tax=Rhizobium sp. Leaf391 TaxID=1736360 RepID=UPI000715A602|nr:hypothetical protein [Rhizobium sp. Leaf391]KQT05066.1 hypothetical protein ASG42_21300 [Rhizobium sp. Leaf391]KQU00976.1 hypothetical protein ASG68_29280 [Rhizobium sp. Leaf453]